LTNLNGSSAKNNNPVLSGGRRITEWHVSEHRQQCCWGADLPEVAAEDWNFRQLFVDGQRRFRSRLPKAGFYRFAALTGKDTDFHWEKGPDNVQYEPGDLQNWRNVQDIDVVIYQLWFDTHQKIKHIDEANHIAQYGIELGRGSHDCRVVACSITDMGAGAQFAPGDRYRQ